MVVAAISVDGAGDKTIYMSKKVLNNGASKPYSAPIQLHFMVFPALHF